MIEPGAVELADSVCAQQKAVRNHSRDSAMLPDVLKKMKGKNTLIVTEKPGLTKQGAAINFIAENNKQCFELNKINIAKYNLKVSSTLEARAVKIE